jgi:hypothetical protein
MSIEYFGSYFSIIKTDMNLDMTLKLTKRQSKDWRFFGLKTGFKARFIRMNNDFIPIWNTGIKVGIL